MLRLCSILGTVLLALAITTPASAKKKKSADDSASSASSGVGGDDQGSSTSKSSKKTSKKKKKGDTKDKAADKADADKAAASAAPAADEPKPEAAPEPDAWEKPPMEQEKPIGPPPKVVEKPSGDGRHWSLGLMLGWAFLTDRRSGGADPYGLGFGIRSGYSFDFKLYVGLFYMYYLGSSESGTTDITMLPSTLRQNYMQFGAEVGYDWWTGPVIVRPSLEIGPSLLLANDGTGTRSIARVMYGPGINVTYPVDQWFIGGEARANLVPSSNGYSSVLLAVHGGMRFE